MSILQQPILVAVAATDSVLAPALVLTAIVVAALFAIALRPGSAYRTPVCADQLRPGSGSDTHRPVPRAENAPSRPRAARPRRAMFRPWRPGFS